MNMEDALMEENEGLIVRLGFWTLKKIAIDYREMFLGFGSMSKFFFLHWVLLLLSSISFVFFT
jgi:hypothetical protein